MLLGGERNGKIRFADLFHIAPVVVVGDNFRLLAEGLDSMSLAEFF
jgi:hypothetical protein